MPPVGICCEPPWLSVSNVLPGRFRPELDGGVTGMTEPVVPAVVSML